ncbi:MAG TPA: hypothetical protein VKY56_02625 [Chloroflexota bacterium]|nr:hypothetical protein [Chloroflexota bacterium]
MRVGADGHWNAFGRTGAAYGIWVLTAALAAVVALIWRSVLLGLFVRLHLNHYAFALYDDVVVLALVLAWLVLLIVAEARCRESANRGRLVAFAARLDGGLGVLGIIGYVLYQLGW